MTYQELIDRLTEDTKYTRREVRLLVEKLAKILSTTLANGQDIQIRGLGTFLNVPAAARTARNPFSGEIMRIPARRRVKFTPNRTLLAEVRASVKHFRSPTPQEHYGLTALSQVRRTEDGQVRSSDRPQEGANGKNGTGRR
jgi:nucleoid DNA-binding protein